MNKLLFVVLILIMNHLFSAEVEKTPPIRGDWSGVLDVKVMQLNIVLHIEQNEENKIKAELYCPQQGKKGVAVDSMTLKDTSLQFEIKNLMASYKGTLNPEGTEFIGKFTQNGASFPLSLKKGIAAEFTLNRPQEPKAPFPYQEEEVTFENPSADVNLSGTFTFPCSQGTFPTVILIAGSGAVDRNEALMGHQPFLVLADHLTKQGIAVLRFDKRGVGKSTGNYDTATSVDFASDVLAGVDYLKTRPEVQQIGLIGHSEGGMIAPMVSQKSKDVNFMILMAGTVVNGEEIILKQSELLLRADGVSETLIEKERALRQEMFSIIKQETDSEMAGKKLREAFTNYLETLPEALKKECLESSAFAVTNPSNIDTILKLLNTPWYRYFLMYEPTSELRQVKIPVLVLNGALDLQVSSQQNLPVISKALKEAGNPDYTILELPQHNHLFQVCKTGSIKEYSEIEETMSPLVLETISTWILKKYPLKTIKN